MHQRKKKKKLFLFSALLTNIADDFMRSCGKKSQRSKTLLSKTPRWPIRVIVIRVLRVIRVTRVITMIRVTRVISD